LRLNFAEIKRTGKKKAQLDVYSGVKSNKARAATKLDSTEDNEQASLSSSCSRLAILSLTAPA
jgi:hypothetical protein